VSATDHPTGVLFSKTLSLLAEADNSEELVLKSLSFPKDFSFKNISLVDVALSTSAAPTYFPSHNIGKYKFVDGGVIANNPALFAHTEASEWVENPKTDILHLSLSTGYPVVKPDGEEVAASD